MKVLLSQPRGFCAGVNMAVTALETDPRNGNVYAMMRTWLAGIGQRSGVVLRAVRRR